MTTEKESRPEGNPPERLEVVARDVPSIPDYQTILQDVDANTDKWWKSCALAAIECLARSGRPFTAYDAAQLGVPDPDHPSRWGGLFSAAAHAGLIRSAGVVRGSRASTHGAWVRVWIGAEYAQGGEAA